MAVSIRTWILIPLVNICILICLLVQSESIEADTLSLTTTVETNLKKTESVFYSSDPGIYLFGKANFCINTELPDKGSYYFRYEITSPEGALVYKSKTQSKSVPKIPKYLTSRLYTSMSFFTTPGYYTLTTYFYEIYPSKNIKISINTTRRFRVFSGSRPGLFSYAPVLLQPLDKAIVSNNPRFVWSPGPANSYYNIYISRSENPEEQILWKASKLKDTQIIYPGIPQLQPNVKYYWMVEIVDAAGRSIGPQGKSEVFSLSTTPLLYGEDILLKYPVEISLENSMPTFKWTSAFPKSNSVSYDIIIAEEFISNIIWSDTTSEIYYSYPAEGPQFKPGKKYFWWVVGKNSNAQSSVSSENTYFEFEGKEIEVGETVDLLGHTSISGNVQNHKKINIPDVQVYFKKVKNTDKEVEIQYSVKTGNDGKFLLSRVIPGLYKVLAEKSSGDFYNFYEANYTVVEGVKNELHIVMDNQEARLRVVVEDENGQPVKNSLIKLTNLKYNWSSRTDDKGEHTFRLPVGRFNIEITKLPSYARYFKNDLVVTGTVDFKITMQSTRSGAAKMTVKEGGTNKPLRGYVLDGKRQ